MSSPARPNTGSYARDSRLPSLGPRGEGWFALQLLFIAGIVAGGVFLGSHWHGAARIATGIVGVALMAFGISVALTAIRALDRSLSPLPRPRDEAVLVRSGVYGRIRHPIYAGLMLLAIGWALLTASWLALALAAAFVLFLDLKARREELWLRQRFPDYDDYVPGTNRFVPGLY